MTKPGIDIEKEAEKVASLYFRQSDERPLKDKRMDDHRILEYEIKQSLLRVEQSAIKAERERCAYVADKQLAEALAHNKNSDVWAIAETIRNLILAPTILARNGETKNG